MFKILNYLNCVFMAFPLLIFLMEMKDEDVFPSTIIAMGCTATLQLFTGIIWLSTEPRSKPLLNYFVFIVLLALVAVMRFKFSVVLLPATLIYFSYILHKKAYKQNTHKF